jgi:hypothetical protein
MSRCCGEAATTFRAQPQAVLNLGISLGVATAGVAVRVGKNVQSIRQGGAALRRAGVIFLFSCSVMGLATGVPSWAALLLLAGAVVLHTYGELWHASGSFALDFALAPGHAQGQYQGLVGVGNGYPMRRRQPLRGPRK